MTVLKEIKKLPLLFFSERGLSQLREAITQTYHHNLDSVSLAVEVFHKSCGPVALHGTPTNFQ